MNVGTANIVGICENTHFFVRIPIFPLPFFVMCVIIMLSLKKRGVKMGISYNKLWKLLIDRNIKKGDLQRLAGISGSSIAKLGRNENVNTDILLKICGALKCDISDIMEVQTITEAKND